TSGIGLIHPQAQISKKRVQKGDKIILSGPLANHGMSIMSVREGLEFDSEIESDTRGLNHTVKRLLDQFGEHIHWLSDPTRGGLATVLKELALEMQLGIEIAQKDLPIDPQVAGACELLGLDPLYVANEGLFVSIVAQEAAEAYLRTLREDKHGQQAQIIGEIVSEHPRQVLLQSAIGGKRVINMLPGEQLPRIC
ncbi:MAG: AIR synthase-related protein, partial [Bacteroidota bacterium]